MQNKNMYSFVAFALFSFQTGYNKTLNRAENNTFSIDIVPTYKTLRSYVWRNEETNEYVISTHTIPDYTYPVPKKVYLHGHSKILSDEEWAKKECFFEGQTWAIETL